MVGTLAGFERAMISKRTTAGLAAALAEGRVLGRPRKLTAAKERKIAESVLSGRQSAAAAARFHKVHKATISRIVTEFRTRGLKEGDRTSERGGVGGATHRNRC
jgi:DNA invertase Pin-like site-specific DNA recombinase